MSCTGLLAMLIVAALDDVVGMPKPLLSARAGGSIAGASSLSPQPTHRQNLELGVASEVIHTAVPMGFDGARAGSVARAALDELTAKGRGETAMTAGPCNASASKAIAKHVTPADIEASIAADYSFTLDTELAGCCWQVGWSA